MPSAARRSGLARRPAKRNSPPFPAANAHGLSGFVAGMAMRCAAGFAVLEVQDGYFTGAGRAAVVVAVQAAMVFRASSRGKYGEAAGRASSRYLRPESQLPDATAARRRHATASAREAGAIWKFK